MRAVGNFGWFVPGLLLAGCVHAPSLAPKEEPPSSSGPPGPAICQIATRWEKDVLYVPDPTHGGAPTPGLAGRLYLASPEGPFVAGDGSLVVDLYDDTPLATGGRSKLIEKWCIDRATLKRLHRKDFIGEGYTLFLPWGTYRKDIKRVHLMACFTPLKGTPLYAPGESLGVNSEKPSVQVTSRTEYPGVKPPAGPNPAPILAQGIYPPPPQPIAVDPAAEGPGLSPPSANDPSAKKSSVIVQRVTWERSAPEARLEH